MKPHHMFSTELAKCTGGVRMGVTGKDHGVLPTLVRMEVTGKDHGVLPTLVRMGVTGEDHGVLPTLKHCTVFCEHE